MALGESGSQWKKEASLMVPLMLCVFNSDNHLSSPSTGDGIFSFTFDITLDDVFPDFTHLEVNWMDPDGKYAGDLISQDIT